MVVGLSLLLLLSVAVAPIVSMDLAIALMVAHRAGAGRSCSQVYIVAWTIVRYSQVVGLTGCAFVVLLAGLSFVCLALRRLVLAQWMAFAGEARDDQTVLMYRLTRCCAGTAIRGWMALIW